MRWLSILLIGLLPAVLVAKTVEGVNLLEQVDVDGKTLVLNGAGVREKFFFDIYVAALYLPAKSSDAKAILQADQPWHLGMHFLYSEVSKKKLDKGWEEGFENNSSAAEMAALRERLQQFKNMFPALRKREMASMTYIPGKGVSVTIKDELKGTIPGADFARTLLSVWLGPDPVTGNLKKALLGSD